jgi:release factor glutamine methyltransferase
LERETIWTTGKVLLWATVDFRERGVALPRLEAELLLSHVLGCRRLDLYTDHDRPLDPAELVSFRQVVTRRRRGEPAAYIRGTREFWSLDIGVTPDVLVPRPETEVLVQACLERVDEGRVLDLGTGSGCIAVALASERPELTIHATDVSAPACAVARANVERHGLEDRVEIFEGDLFDAVPQGARYTAIVSNPPYVADGELEALDAEVRCEPRTALAGGPDGLDVIRRILAGAPDHLEPGGLLLMEIDPRQAAAVIRSLGPQYLGVTGETITDLSGRERVAVFRLPL